MGLRWTALCLAGTLLTGGTGWWLAAHDAASKPIQAKTLAPEGPFRVAGGRLVDSNGRAFLIRGTELPEFRAETWAHESRSGADFGPYSATSMAAIRLRFNMNAMRLPVSDGSPEELVRLVRRANEFELLVIVAGAPAALFRDEPNVLFEAASADELRELRAAGVRAPIVTDVETDDPNVIRVTRWDLDLEDPAACAAIPRDPELAAAMIEAKLDSFDQHETPWIVSRFVPGKLIWDLSLHHATTLENGWTCGGPADPRAGLGRLVQGHMRTADPRALFVVGGSGSFEIARGAVAIAYGPVMAQRDADHKTIPLPAKLAGVSVMVTDSQGVERPAGMLWASEGWGQVNFVVPEDSAEGPARMTLVRDDGSRLGTNLTIARTAPGFWSHVSDRGPAAGSAVYLQPDGSLLRERLTSCDGGLCEPLLVRMNERRMWLEIDSSGFRFARPEEIEVRLGGVPVRVVRYEADPGMPGKDRVTVEVPPALRVLGEADLVAVVNGRVSNVVGVRIGE